MYSITFLINHLKSLFLQDIDYAENANKTYASLMSSRFMEVYNFGFLVNLSAKFKECMDFFSLSGSFLGSFGA